VRPSAIQKMRGKIEGLFDDNKGTGTESELEIKTWRRGAIIEVKYWCACAGNRVVSYQARIPQNFLKALDRSESGKGEVSFLVGSFSPRILGRVLWYSVKR